MFSFSNRNVIYRIIISLVLILGYQNCAPSFQTTGDVLNSGSTNGEGAGVAPPFAIAPPAEFEKLCDSSKDSIKVNSLRRLSNIEIKNSIYELINENIISSSLPSESVNKYLLTRDGSTQSIGAGGAGKYYKQFEQAIDKLIAKQTSDLLSCKAIEASKMSACFENNLYKLIYRAWRRPLTPEIKIKVMSFFNATNTFEESIKAALLSTFLSPKFLYVSFDSAGGTRSLTNFEIAERLSFLVWGMVPDIELLEIASRGELTKQDDLRNAVISMFNNVEKSRNYFDAFMSEWIGLDELRLIQRSDPKFNDQLVADMHLESVYFFEDLFRTNAPITSMFDAEYTIISEKLAEVYDVAWASLPSWEFDSTGRFKKIKLPSGRKGIVTLASVLTRNATHDKHASATQRGYWGAKKVTCQKPGAVPDDIPLEIKEIEGSVRVMLESHVKGVACQGCHTLMDPIGFGLGQFDALGQFITKDAGGYDIDTSGEILNKKFTTVTDMLDIFSEAQEVKDCFFKPFYFFYYN